MPKIAYTKIGRNALVCGLVGHAAAMLVGMTTAAGGELFFTIIYPLSWFILVIAAYAEWKHRGYEPAGEGRFYGTAIVAVIPVIGPCTLLVRLYKLPNKGGDESGIAGFFTALGRLKANVLVLFVVFLFLFLLFAVLHMKEDPYFKRRTPPQASIQGAVNDAGHTGYAAIGKESKYPC
ncbi:MAG: hypothetical protein EG826_16305 [Deltaproteobacteria bacterium]|nr:hypothetical protein [Deltaproteobacteria bacterium]